MNKAFIPNCSFQQPFNRFEQRFARVLGERTENIKTRGNEWVTNRILSSSSIKVVLWKSRVTINLPFDLAFIEFFLDCWCFDFQDCNFLTSMFIIGDGLSSFRTVLIFLSMTSRFPFIFVFWKCVTSYRSNADITFFLSPGCQFLQTWAAQMRATPRAGHDEICCSCWL